MANLLLSEAEKTFVVHGVQEDLRADGRSRHDLRPITVETDLITHTSGSAHLRLANTDILVGVKAELEERPLLHFSVDCSANATPQFEGRGGENLATEIGRALQRAYAHPRVFPLEQLVVLRDQQCWALYVDILILECGGNLFDAVSLAVKAALHNTRIPRVKVTAVDGGQPELELSDDPYDGQRLQMGRAPVLVTLTRVGNHCVVDPTPEEEACASAGLVLGVTPEGRVTAVRKIGAGSFHRETMAEAVRVGTDVGKNVNRVLLEKLKQEEEMGLQRKKIGFLGR